MDGYLNLGRDLVLNHFASKDCEGNIPYMYLDTGGKVTIGIGHLLTLEYARTRSFIFRKTGMTATPDQVAAEYTKIQNLVKLIGKAAERFEPHTELILNRGEVEQIFDEDITHKRDENHNEGKTLTLKRILPDIESYPWSARLALLDLVFNGGLRTKTPLFIAAKNREWGKAAKLCYRSNVGKHRNDQTKAFFQWAAMQKSVLKVWDETLKTRPRYLLALALFPGAAPLAPLGLGTLVRPRVEAPAR